VSPLPTTPQHRVLTWPRAVAKFSGGIEASSSLGERGRQNNSGTIDLVAELRLPRRSLRIYHDRRRSSF
jgi:hypothetical protein